jgi:exodeoxyribonuclease VII large subunit
VLARGGGSIEDLWAFNEEIVARAISASALPVVSAVGHEIDFTIADFVADVRAATPSAASTIVLADYVDVRTRLDALTGHAIKDMRSRIAVDLDFIEGLASRYGLRRIADRILSGARDVDEAMASSQRIIKNAIESRKASLAAAAGKIEALNPLSTLARGYAVCYKGTTAERVTSYTQVSPGDKVRVLFAKGRAICEVQRSEKETG